MSDEPIPFYVRCKNPECKFFITTKYFTTYTDRTAIAAQMGTIQPFEQKCYECGQAFTYVREDVGIIGGKTETPPAPSTPDTEEPQEP